MYEEPNLNFSSLRSSTKSSKMVWQLFAQRRRVKKSFFKASPVVFLSHDDSFTFCLQFLYKKNLFLLFAQDWMSLAVGKEGDMNAMTISWGTLGELWGHPVVTVYVSSSRYTHSFMERNEYFTVTGVPEEKCSALQYIGSHSGRDDKDKISKAGLTPSFTELGNPIFEEANLSPSNVASSINRRSTLPSSHRRSSRYTRRGLGIHTMYIGEIVNTWIK